MTPDDPDLTALFTTPQIHTDEHGVHQDGQGREYVAVVVGGETTYEPADLVAERDNYQRATTNLSIENNLLRHALSTLIREAEDAISRIPGECRYHGKILAARPNMTGQTACCDTGAPSLAKRGAVAAIKAARAALDGGS